MTSSANDISSMLRQQSQVSADVTKSMEKITDLADQNLSSIHHVESAAENLSKTSQSLYTLLKPFEKSL